MGERPDSSEYWGAFFFVLILGFFFWLAHALPGCGDTFRPGSGELCAPEVVAPAEAYIWNGEPSTDRRATVFVQLGQGRCSGIVVGPYTVLTAKHCSDPRQIAVEDVGIYNVVGAEEHPGAAIDIMVIYTNVRLPEPYAEFVDDPVGCSHLLAQGYGRNAPQELHERRAEYVWRTRDWVFTGESICNGDSGGPLYVVYPDGTWRIMGVTSFGLYAERGQCEDIINGFVNMMTHGDWVEEMTI